MRKLPKLKGEIKLDLGCADNVLKGFIGVDFRDYGQQIIWDVREGLPFADNSVKEIYSCHMLEHLNEDENEEFFRELYRVLELGALFVCRVPHSNAPTAHYIGHKSLWNELRAEVWSRDPSGFLGNFAVLRNERIGDELFFTLKKI